MSKEAQYPDERPIAIINVSTPLSDADAERIRDIIHNRSASDAQKAKRSGPSEKEVTLSFELVEAQAQLERVLSTIRSHQRFTPSRSITDCFLCAPILACAEALVDN